MADMTVPRMDFSILGDLPKTYKDARREAVRERTLAELGQGGQIDYNAAAAKLLPVDPQMAMTLAQLGNSQRDFQFRQGEAQRAQGNADRDYNLRRDTATTGETKVVKDANGNETLVRIDRQGNPTTINTGASSAAPNNPFAPAGTQTEGQANASLYARRMFQAEKVLRDVEGAGTEIGQYAIANTWGLPDPVRNKLHSTEYQKFDQARRDFVNATLRRESGAVISDAEFSNANKQYFPQPGDTKEVIEQKRRNRQEAISGIAGAAGRQYRPEFSFGPDGSLIPRQAEQPGQAQQPRGISRAEYDALPPGSPYTAPDGSQRVKR